MTMTSITLWLVAVAGLPAAALCRTTSPVEELADELAARGEGRG
ncbi:hypothetical protein [Streptomyces sp. NBRC 109706]|nr:hypothetical protein [Streptomyces sp. NBRC 109706]